MVVNLSLAGTRFILREKLVNQKFRGVLKRLRPFIFREGNLENDFLNLQIDFNELLKQKNSYFNVVKKISIYPCFLFLKIKILLTNSIGKLFTVMFFFVIFSSKRSFLLKNRMKGFSFRNSLLTTVAKSWRLSCIRFTLLSSAKTFFVNGR